MFAGSEMDERDGRLHGKLRNVGRENISSVDSCVPRSSVGPKGLRKGRTDGVTNALGFDNVVRPHGAYLQLERVPKRLRSHGLLSPDLEQIGRRSCQSTMNG